MKETGFKTKSEVTISIEQNQLLITKSHNANIMNILTDDKWRFAISMDETREYTILMSVSSWNRSFNDVTNFLHINLYDKYLYKTPAVVIEIEI